MPYLGKALTCAATSAAMMATILVAPATATPTPGPVPTPLTFDFDADGHSDQLEPFTSEKTQTANTLTCTLTYVSGATKSTATVDFDIALHLEDGDPEAVCPMVTSSADFDGSGKHEALLIWPQMVHAMTGASPKPGFITVDAAGSVTNRWLTPGGSSYTYEEFYFAPDLDGDADSDLIVVQDELWTAYRNDGAGVFTEFAVPQGDQILWGDFDQSSPGMEALSYGSGYNPEGPLNYVDFATATTSVVLPGEQGCIYTWDRFAHNHLSPLRIDDHGYPAADLRRVCDTDEGDRSIDLRSDGRGHFTLRSQSDDVHVVTPSRARRDRVTMYEGRFEKADINVLGNDILGSDVTVALSKAPTVGTAVALDNGRIRYDRRDKGAAADSFTYTITDVNGRTSTATVYIHVVAKSSIAARNDRVRFHEGRFEKAAINVLGNDQVGSGVTVSLATEPTIGTATVLDNGRIWYDRTGKGTERDVFKYTITAADGTTSTARVLIEVAG